MTTNSFEEPQEFSHKEVFTCAKCKHEAIITEVFLRQMIEGGEWSQTHAGTRHNTPPDDCDCDCHVPWHMIHHTQPQVKETVNG